MLYQCYFFNHLGRGKSVSDGCFHGLKRKSWKIISSIQCRPIWCTSCKHDSDHRKKIWKRLTFVGVAWDSVPRRFFPPKWQTMYKLVLVAPSFESSSSNVNFSYGGHNLRRTDFLVATGFSDGNISEYRINYRKNINFCFCVQRYTLSYRLSSWLRPSFLSSWQPLTLHWIQQSVFV